MQKAPARERSVVEDWRINPSAPSKESNGGMRAKIVAPSQ